MRFWGYTVSRVYGLGGVGFRVQRMGPFRGCSGCVGFRGLNNENGGGSNCKRVGKCNEDGVYFEVDLDSM